MTGACAAAVRAGSTQAGEGPAAGCARKARTALPGRVRGATVRASTEDDVLGDKAEARTPRVAIAGDPRGREAARILRVATDAAAWGFAEVAPGSERAHWHPHCTAFAAYIESLGVPGRLPTRGMFEPTAIYRLLPQVWIADVQREPLRLAVRLVGTKVVEALGRDVTGLSFADAFAGLDPVHDLERYAFTVATRRGTWRRGPAWFDVGQGWAEIEDVVMPFAADGATVDMLYCCAVFYGYDRRDW